MAKKVIIVINPKTKAISYEIDGVSGQSCTELTESLTRGDEVTDQKLKAEYHDGAQLPVWEQEG